MSIYLEPPYLDFWSCFHFKSGKQGEPIELEIIQRTDEVFKSTNPQVQDQNNRSNFIEDLEVLEKRGFFKELSFLDLDRTPIEGELKTPNYTKQADEIVNDFKRQTITNSYENGQNSNNSPKKTSLLRRSERIAKRKLASSIQSPSPKRQCLLPMKLQIGAKENTLFTV